MIKFIGIIRDDYCMEYEQLPKDAILINEEKTDKFGLCAQPRAINLTGGNPV